MLFRSRLAEAIATPTFRPYVSGDMIGAEAGEITSSVYSPAQGCAIALAYVRSLYAAPGQALAAGDMAAVVTG